MKSGSETFLTTIQMTEQVKADIMSDMGEPPLIVGKPVTHTRLHMHISTFKQITTFLLYYINDYNNIAILL
eukprot:COSAG06_NODE_2369_length_6995_cov_7.327001_2_plen_71_part_00